MKQTVILNIVFFFLVHSIFPVTLKASAATLKEESELKKVLENIEKNSDMKFIYSDDLIKGKFAESFSMENISKEEVRKLLGHAGLSYRLFGDKTFVLYEEAVKEKPKRQLQKVVTNEEFIQKGSSYMMLKPILLSTPTPQYPYEAVRKELEGKVKVKFKVDTKGNVVKSYILETSGEVVLDSVSREYVYNLKYSPATVNGIECEVWVTMTFDYILRDSVYRK